MPVVVGAHANATKTKQKTKKKKNFKAKEENQLVKASFTWNKTYCRQRTTLHQILGASVFA